MSRPPLQYRIAAFFGQCAERIGAAWSWFVGPIERFIARLGEGALGALDSFEGLESAVVAALRFIFWPVLFAFSLVGRLLPRSEAPGTGRVGRAFQWFGKRAYQLAESFNLDGVVRFVVWLLTPVWWPIVQLLGFTNAWLATRSPRELALATPAVLALVPFLLVALQGAWLGQAGIAERYKVAVRDAVEQGDYERVDLLERKLAQLGVDTRRRDYRTALALESDGELAQAYERMKRLASAERPGYPSAHIWIAQRLLTGDLTEAQEPLLAESETAAAELAEQHLDRLAEMEINGAGVSRLRAFVLTKTDRPREAEEALRPFADGDRGVGVMRMRLLAALRDLEPARNQARVVIEMMGAMRPSEASEDDFLAWALAAELLSDPRQMDAALTAWHTSDPASDRPRELLAQFRREQTERLVKNPTTSPTRAAEVLAEAASLGSSSSWINAQVANLAGSPTLHGRRVWEALLAQRDNDPRLVQAAGTAAAGAGKITTARELLKSLIDSGNTEALVWNNYAWTLIQDPDPEPEAALVAIEHALELAPTDYRFRETRGQVKLVLGRWDEAIKDLEFALNGLPESREVHLSLATAYDALAKPVLAEVHRRQASR